MIFWSARPMGILGC